MGNPEGTVVRAEELTRLCWRQRGALVPGGDAPRCGREGGKLSPETGSPQGSHQETAGLRPLLTWLSGVGKRDGRC